MNDEWTKKKQACAGALGEISKMQPEHFDSNDSSTITRPRSSSIPRASSMFFLFQNEKYKIECVWSKLENL